MTGDPNKDRLLANRYKLVELVGEGAMGRVYLAKDTLLGGVTVAVKFLSQTLLNQKMCDRFEREATICAILGEKSNHIVRVRDYGVDEYDIPFYVMEFLKGESLSEIIQDEPLPLKRFLNLTRQICLGIECAHQGIIFKEELCAIIHRDIKPSNILVTQDRTLEEWVKILDFGIAKLSQSNQSQTHSFMGTLAYCSPEQMEGRELDNRSDIYSLGVMMYEMLTGDMPLLPESSSFGGWYIAHHESPPKTFSPELNLPEALEKLVMQCLAKEPKDRPQSIAEIFKVLEQIESKQKSKELKRPVSSTTIVTPKPVSNPKTYSNVEDFYLNLSWPQDKPQKKIVFPRLISTPEGEVASLFAMLDSQDLVNRKSSSRYNKFLFLSSPHPMLLWLTVLYNRQHGARWLPCYLDLKKTQGKKISQVLGKLGSYRILLFDLNKPEQCYKVITSTIAPEQRNLLKEWAHASQFLKKSNRATVSKKLLKQEYEKLKPKIVLKLEATHTGYSTNLPG